MLGEGGFRIVALVRIGNDDVVEFQALCQFQGDKNYAMIGERASLRYIGQPIILNNIIQDPPQITSFFVVVSNDGGDAIGNG